MHSKFKLLRFLLVGRLKDDSFNPKDDSSDPRSCAFRHNRNPAALGSPKIKKGIIIAMGTLALIVFLGQSGRTIHGSTVPRELPIYSVERVDSIVALGINCAWGDEDIDPMLATLAEKEVKATFFLVGNWCKRFPDSARKIAAAGHELGSHSQTHPDMTTLSREEITQQLDTSKETIQSITEQEIHLFRPPSGAYNNLTVSTARALGWEVVQWDCDTLDWQGGTPREIVENGTKKLQSGSILLLHAGAKHTAEALPSLIDKIQGEGYILKPVGELLYLPPYSIDHTGRQLGSVANEATAKRNPVAAKQRGL